MTGPSGFSCAPWSKTRAAAGRPEPLKPALAGVEAKVPVRSTLKAAELPSLSDRFRAAPDYRSRMRPYPLFALPYVPPA